MELSNRMDCVFQLDGMFLFRSNHLITLMDRDDMIRFTDMNSLQECAVVKLDEQPKLLRAAGSTIVVACQRYDPSNYYYY